MATVTTNNYFQLPAEAYQGIFAQFSGLTTLADGSTFTASYSSGGSSLGAKLTLEVTDFGGANHRVMNSYMSSAQSGCQIPCRMLMNFGTLTSQKQVAPAAGAVHWTVDQLMSALLPAVKDMIEDLSDGTVTLGTVQTKTYPPNARPMIAWCNCLVESSNDMCLFTLAFVDQSMSYNPLLNTTPLYMPVFSNGISNFFSSPSSGSEPLDMDVAINNGASIFSVVSKTFTEP